MVRKDGVGENGDSHGMSLSRSQKHFNRSFPTAQIHLTPIPRASRAGTGKGGVGRHRKRVWERQSTISGHQHNCPPTPPQSQQASQCRAQRADLLRGHQITLSCQELKNSWAGNGPGSGACGPLSLGHTFLTPFRLSSFRKVRREVCGFFSTRCLHIH